MTTYIIIGIAVLVLIYTISTYNKLIKYKNLTEEAFSTMDVYLKKRWDLIPNLVEIVKGYVKHEESTLTRITDIRSKSYDNMPINEKININQQLTQGISTIMAVAENYPDLKANQSFADLGNSLTEVENEIANSRKYYNGTVRILNNTVKMFPNNILSKLFGFKESTMFEANANEKINVKVDLQ